MTRDELFTMLGHRLGQRADVIPYMELEYNLLQEISLEQHSWLPWFLRKDRELLAVSAGDETVDLPDDFLREDDEGDQAVWMVIDGTYTPLTKYNPEQFLDVQEAGYYGYVLGVNNIQFSPPISTTGSIALTYYAKAPIPAGAETNDWITYASDVILAKLGFVMAGKYTHETALADRFMQDEAIAYDRFYKFHTARLEAGRGRKLEV